MLVAKLSVGELAMGDVWFGGTTRTPWDVSQGSSGSSAGSGAAVAGGLVGFAIGTETYGSIISPSTQCRVTGLRPTFGRVSRHGVMMLSWTMDKVGPMARTAEDCALVFDALYGPDGKDRTLIDRPFQWPSVKPNSALRIGYTEVDFEKESEHNDRQRAALEILRKSGFDLVPVKLPDYPIEPLTIILNAEAASSFDELTRHNHDDKMVRQVKEAWPNFFRQARLIPAVEYIQAQRVRELLGQAMAELMATVDVYVTPSFSASLFLTNLTGQPAVVVPNGVATNGKPSSITFVGKLYGETEILAAAKVFQAATGFHHERPTFANSEQAAKAHEAQ